MKTLVKYYHLAVDGQGQIKQAKVA